MSPTRLRWLALSALVLVPACGGRSLDSPEALPIRAYPADKDFTMTFIMTSCSDTCATYEVAECSVDVDTEARTIDVDASVSYGEKDGVDAAALEGCTLACGAPVVAHCSVPALGEGTYRVNAGTFRGEITISK